MGILKKKIKILGSGPTGALLALALASKHYQICLIEPLTDLELLRKDKGYAITQCSRKIFQDLGIWDSIKEFVYGFHSLSIIDDQLSQTINVRLNDLKYFNKDQKYIGWVIEHKYLMQILIDSINSNKAINKFNIDNTDSKDFDFVLAADGKNSTSRKNWKVGYLKSLYDQKCISFRAILKGAPQKRAYEVFRHEGPLALLPLDNDIYQVIWFSSEVSTQSKLQLSSFQLLEELKNILPDKIYPQEIISDISNYSVSQAFALPKIHKFRNVLVGDAAHSFHPVGGQGLNSCIRDVYELSNMIKNFDKSLIINRKIFAFNYFCKRFIDIFSLILFTDFLVKLFSNKNIFLYPIRFLIFYLLRKIKFFRVNIFSVMTDSLKRYDFD